MSAFPVHHEGAELVTATAQSQQDRAEFAAKAFLARYRVATTRKGYALALKQWFAFCAEHFVDPLDAQRFHIEVFARELEATGRTVTRSKDNGRYAVRTEAQNRSRVVGAAPPAERAGLPSVASRGGLWEVALAGPQGTGPSGGLPAPQRMAPHGTSRGRHACLRRAPLLRAHPPVGRVTEPQLAGPGAPGPHRQGSVVAGTSGEVHPGADPRDPCASRCGRVVPRAGSRLRHAPAEHRPDLPSRGLLRRDLIPVEYYDRGRDKIERNVTHGLAAFIERAK